MCYLALCETSYPPHLAFSYLEAVHNEFIEQHGQRVHRAQRPYHFIEFSESMLLRPTSFGFGVVGIFQIVS